MSDDASDVTKALAAFGAPSIRYHSFGQSQGRPSGINLPRRPAATTLPPAFLAPEAEPVTTRQAEPVVTQQAEPVAAPEPMASVRYAPAPMPPPRPAALAPEAPPRPAPLFPPTVPPATVAAPSRPLAEWAAPVTSLPPRPIVAPPIPVMAPPVAEPVYIAPPPPESAPVRVPVPMVVTPTSLSSLPEIFDFLAAS